MADAVVDGFEIVDVDDEHRRFHIPPDIGQCLVQMILQQGAVGQAGSAIEQGFEAYVITDASGDISDEAHERAVERMIAAGAKPVTALQYLLELQRDWARTDSYDMTTGIARKWGGAYGLGITYAKTMFNASEGGH